MMTTDLYTHALRLIPPWWVDLWRLRLQETGAVLRWKPPKPAKPATVPREESLEDFPESLDDYVAEESAVPQKQHVFSEKTQQMASHAVHGFGRAGQKIRGQKGTRGQNREKIIAAPRR